MDDQVRDMATTTRFQSPRSWEDDESLTVDTPPRPVSSKPTPTAQPSISHAIKSFEEIVALSPNGGIPSRGVFKGPCASASQNFWSYPDTDTTKEEDFLDPAHAAPGFDSRTDTLLCNSIDNSTTPGSPQSVNVPLSPHGEHSPAMGRDGSRPLPPVSPSWYHGGGWGLIPVPERAQRHPFAEGFEPPRWRMISVHVLLCVIAYPLLLICTVVATKGKTLFWTRLVVGLGCGIVGFCLGLSLLALGKAFFEAATWATVVHQSRVEHAPGIKLKDLAANSTDSTSILTACRLLLDRRLYPGTSRKVRSHYDRRPWSLFILFFIVILVMETSLVFVLGRLIDITTAVKHQQEAYEEIAISGDNSDRDITHATQLRSLFDNYALTWTLSPFSQNGYEAPSVVTLQYKNDSVYFAETILSQLMPNGSGFGTFDTEQASWALEGDEGPASQPTSQKVAVNPISKDVQPGSTLRFPKWGTRLHCEPVPNIQTNLVPRSAGNFTYLFTPKSVIQSLAASFTDVAIQDSLQVPPFDSTKVLHGNDTIPPGLNVSEIGIGATFYDNGVSHSFFSIPLSKGQDGNGWISFEQVLVRLNTTYAPNGTFPILGTQSVPDATGKATQIGYDAVVCLQLFEPWVVEVYNSTTGPSTVGLVERGNVVRSTNTGQEAGEKMIGAEIGGVTRELNSNRLWDVYSVAHTNSINEFLKDNGRDSYYVPSQTVISFTNGSGAYGYTSLSPDKFAQARGRADSTHILPFFAGSGLIVARKYQDLVLSNASINTFAMLVYLTFVLLVGLIAGLFVPRLPLGMPRRGFELYTWMAAFQAGELVGESNEDGGEKEALRNMELHEIERAMGGLKFRYTK